MKSQQEIKAIKKEASKNFRPENLLSETNKQKNHWMDSKAKWKL